MDLINIDRKDSSVSSKLRCKSCGLFFRDNGKGGKCPECGQTLKRIKVHKVKIKNLKVSGVIPKVRM